MIDKSANAGLKSLPKPTVFFLRSCDAARSPSLPGRAHRLSSSSPPQDGVGGGEDAHQLVHLSALQVPQGKNCPSPAEMHKSFEALLIPAAVLRA